MRISIREARDLCVKILVQRGLSKKDARLVVEEYLDGELRGRQCHGLPAFAKFAVEPTRKRQGNYRVEKENNVSLLINGMGNKAQIILNKYLPKLISKAKRSGIAMLGMHNAVSYLMPGTYARKLAEKDLIALIFNYGGWPRICPTGSIDPVFGTNPLAAGIPADNFPIVLDMGTAKLVMGKVRLARKLNKLIAAGVALDKNGRPTRDPAKAITGALLPFGEHKGYGLALIIEVLSKSLFDINHLAKNKANRGFLFIVINPGFFGPISKFKSNVSKLIKKVKVSRKAKGVKEIFVPGERSEKIKRQNLKKGYLEIDDRIMEEIKALL